MILRKKYWHWFLAGLIVCQSVEIAAQDQKTETVTTIDEINLTQVGTRYSSIDKTRFGKEGTNQKSLACQPFYEKAEELVAAKFMDGYYAQAFHNRISFNIFTDLMTLNDGSAWTIHPWYHPIVLKWDNSDTIFIRPNNAWFSPYNYVLHNYSTGEAAEVNLTLASNYLQIVGMDFIAGIAFLSDGSAWYLNKSDYKTYDNWRSGDRIIVGLNYPLASLFYTYILINAEDVTYCESN